MSNNEIFITIRFTRLQHENLRKKSYEDKISINEIVRKAVEAYFAKEKTNKPKV